MAARTGVLLSSYDDDFALKLIGDDPEGVGFRLEERPRTSLTAASPRLPPAGGRASARRRPDIGGRPPW